LDSCNCWRFLPKLLQKEIGLCVRKQAVRLRFLLLNLSLKPELFEGLRFDFSETRVALKPYITVGDPDLSTTSEILSNKVIVEGSEKHNPLNEGSILWISETRLPLGIIHEVFGPVKNPFYVVRYNSDDEVPQGISIGVAISFVVDFSNHILNENTSMSIGIDDEGAADEVEFSDDEKEVEYKRSLHQSKRDATMGNRRLGL
ncbi:uncharacterized protein A4U43_C06F9370, partial [Asparagus officinalis]